MEDEGHGLVMEMWKIRGGAGYVNGEDKGKGLVMGMGKIRGGTGYGNGGIILLFYSG